MRLLAFMMHTPINHMTMSWADPADQQAAGLGSIEHWQNLARLLESGLFDGVFFADVPAVYEHYKDNINDAIHCNVNWPTHDPGVLIDFKT